MLGGTSIGRNHGPSVAPAADAIANNAIVNKIVSSSLLSVPTTTTSALTKCMKDMLTDAS